MPSAPQTGADPLVSYLINDRYPLHYGAKATVSTVTATVRLAEIGYRLQYCDLLRELIEGDPHAYGTLQQRFSMVSGRPWSIQPAVCDEPEKAEIVADFVCNAIHAIPRWEQHVHGLLWGICYGVTAREVMWDRSPDRAWIVKELRFVHTRRLGYDWDWDLRVSDYGYAEWGVKLKDYPGKFITFEPMLSEEYPTREGLGRTLAYWLAFKRFAIRDMLSYVERFGHPIPIVTWKTGREAADEDDVTLAETASRQLGIGTSAGAAIPDTLDVSLSGTGTTATGSGSGENTPHKATVTLVDEQVSKLVLGQAFTTNKDQGSSLGSKGDSYSAVTRAICKGDAQQIEGAIDNLIRWIVRLNFGNDIAETMCPHYSIQLDDDDNSKDFADTIVTLAGAGLEIPTAWVSDRFGIPARQNDEPILGSANKMSETPDEGDEEDEEEKEDDS